MSTRPAVLVDGVSKTFQIPHEQVHTLKERALHPFRRAGHDDLRALRDVSFAVERGEFFGIVGRNGSGKSTLLKCLAGIYRTDRGRIYVDGRMSTFIELGVGFNMDLAAYDNVLLNATMLGLSQRETRARYDRIIDFAELREFADLKLKNYSSGMLVRLAFSVMIQVDADILLIDEVLAVGDAAFQQKCYDEFARIRRSGTTVLFVTHDMNAVQRFCDRAMLLEHGRPVELGEPERVGDRYLQLNFSRDARDAEAREAGDAAAARAGRRASAGRRAGTPRRRQGGDRRGVTPRRSRPCCRRCGLVPRHCLRRRRGPPRRPPRAPRPRGRRARSSAAGSGCRRARGRRARPARPCSSSIARSQKRCTAPMSWVTRRTVVPLRRMRANSSKHFCWNAASPTASTSSISRMSASTWIITANASRTSMPDE